MLTIHSVMCTQQRLNAAPIVIKNEKNSNLTTLKILQRELCIKQKGDKPNTKHPEMHVQNFSFQSRFYSSYLRLNIFCYILKELFSLVCASAHLLV